MSSTVLLFGFAILAPVFLQPFRYHYLRLRLFKEIRACRFHVKVFDQHLCARITVLLDVHAKSDREAQIRDALFDERASVIALSIGHETICVDLIAYCLGIYILNSSVVLFTHLLFIFNVRNYIHVIDLQGLQFGHTFALITYMSYIIYVINDNNVTQLRSLK